MRVGDAPPVGLIRLCSWSNREQSSKGRIPQLIPIRYGRMMQTSFTWYRGVALNMTAGASQQTALLRRLIEP
jgi:hypothetical protein